MLVKEIIGWVLVITVLTPESECFLSLGVNCLKLDQDGWALRYFSHPLAGAVLELRTCFRNSLCKGICLVSGPIRAG